jgi:hypothetical protein
VTCCSSRQQAGQQTATQLALVVDDRLTAWNRDTKGRLISVASDQGKRPPVVRRTWEAPVSWPIRGLSTASTPGYPDHGILGIDGTLPLLVVSYRSLFGTVRESLFFRPDVCRLAPPHTRGFFALRASATNLVDFRLRRHQTDSRRRKVVATGFLPRPVMSLSCPWHAPLGGIERTRRIRSHGGALSAADPPCAQREHNTFSLMVS